MVPFMGKRPLRYSQKLNRQEGVKMEHREYWTQQGIAELVEAQDGDAHDVYDTARLPLAPVQLEVPSEAEGYISRIECEKVGLISMHLGGGRAAKEDAIDLSVGLVLHKKVGDKVETGESLATIHASTMEKAQAAANSLRACCTFSDTPVQRPQLIKDILFS
jgi:pyrimidine-nucleoside phosphorylase